MKVVDTDRLENAYRPFGNVAFVDHWYKAPSLIGSMRPVVENRTLDLCQKPKHFQRVLQMEYRPAERLRMNELLDFALVMRNGKYISTAVKTAYDLELAARKKKKHDWRVEIITAFTTYIYQRQGKKKWVLIEMGRGYA